MPKEISALDEASPDSASCKSSPSSTALAAIWQPFPIIWMGPLADGLEALKKLFVSVPREYFPSFALVQPLLPPYKALKLPIDIFFRSPTEALDEQASGITLSDTGSDESRDWRAIEKQTAW